MKALCAFVLVICLLLPSGPVLAAATEFSRGQTTVTVGSNTLTADNNVKYVNYTVGEVLTVTLNYSATCDIEFSGLTQRSPKPYTPRGVAGVVSNVTGTPPAGSPATSGSVTFDIQFTSLKKAGKSKQFGVAHLKLVLGVDDDCDGSIDDTVNIGVQLSVSTASHP
ncbi:MAG: hypothetical protein HY725_00975 [Candidatus Rokubacteria bacterium]|nr:hypothetical protein [Candidatus Rokubacteria bacterium]